MRKAKILAITGGYELNADGNPWEAQHFNCRFFRLEKKLGVKYALTAIRHSFATRLLEADLSYTELSVEQVLRDLAAPDLAN